MKYVLFVCFCLVSVVRPADYYLTPTGAGAMDGSSWDNAARGSGITAFVNSSLTPGDRLLIGNYNPNRLTKAESGATITLNACEKFVTDKIGTHPDYVADDPAWQGHPDHAFNGRTFGPALGYWMGEISVIEKRSTAPLDFSLGQNFPNPFNPTTTIPYSIQRDAHITIRIYNANGQVVHKLFQGYQTAGDHEIDFYGQMLPSGIYFYQLTSSICDM